jgi:YgiT-type zinc finger domain-containing protein
MKCVFCGGKMQKQIVVFQHEDAGRWIIVENVPAEVCAECGETEYSREVVDKVMRFAKSEFPPAKTIQVPVFDFLKSA